MTAPQLEGVPPSLSIIIPVRDEADNIEPLITELEGFRAAQDRPLEVILVDDGSRDGSWKIVQRMAVERPWLKALRFRANRGQTAAMTAGIQHSSGKYIAFLDADMQNDPADIPRLLQPIIADEGDVVCGWRRHRQDNAFSRTLPSVIANWLIRRVLKLKIHDVGCTLKVFRREFLDDANLIGEMHRFLAADAQAHGARLLEMEVNHRPRTRGHSKYGWSRMGKVLIDLLTMVMLSSYSASPAYLFGKVAAVLFGLGTIAFVIVGYRVLIEHRYETTPMVFIWILSYISALIALMSGLLAEINIRVLYQVGVRKPYEIGESIGFGS
jgi:glycosyltransferase involved in cell wall biosynthesis